MTNIEAHLSSLGFVQSTTGVWTGTVPDGCPVHATIRLHPVKGINIAYTRTHWKLVKNVAFSSPCKTLDEVKLALALAHSRWLDESASTVNKLQREHLRRLACHI